MVIDDTRLPQDVERGVKGGPQFNTIVLRSDGGNTDTNQNWQYPLYSGNVGYGIQSRQELDKVIRFFWARRGRLRGFLFRDWSDYQMELETIGTGDGSNRTFPIVKTYDDDVLSFARPIKRPIESTLTVYVNGAAVPDSHWSLQSGGVILFGVTHAPVAASSVAISGEFDIPVMFMTDKLDISMELWNAGSIPSIPIMEVRES